MLNWDEDPKFRFAEQNNLMSNYKWLNGYKLLSKYGGSFDLQVWPWQLEEAANLARNFPDIPIILNHTGMPIKRKSEDIQLWKKGLKSLTKEPNTSVKISALGMLDQNWTTDSIKPLHVNLEFMIFVVLKNVCSLQIFLLILCLVIIKHYGKLITKLLQNFPKAKDQHYLVKMQSCIIEFKNV